MFINKKYLQLTLLSLAFCILMMMSCNKAEEIDLKWPEITQTTHPWTRWWWMGSAVNKSDLKAVMKNYKAHGLGGLEITPIYGVKGTEDQFIEYLSPEWMDMLQFTLNEAKKLNLGIDMDNTAGWPFGGPWVESENESKSVFYKTYALKGGETLKHPVQFEQKSMARAVSHHVSIDDIKEPISANEDLQEMALGQVVFPKQLPLKALVAYADDGKIVKLIDKVDSTGHLNWTAPEGSWKLFAVFEGWHGKMVERAAPGGEGFVIDPFSKNALNDYLRPFDSAFKDYDIKYLRAVFNDSYEVDDASGEADWTPQFFADFNKLRGYDLRGYLPALFGKSNIEENERVISDYRETISDLLLNNFTLNWKEWAHKKDAIIRNQAHGSPANILDLYAASDIPETEGYEPIKIKFASSAGHVSGKSLISSESCTWLDEHFLGTLAEAKKTVNRFLLNGVNHIFYHGTTYSPPHAPWPGWLFYAAVDFSPSNSFWDDFAALNTYVTRIQSFLQKGKPDNDILVYYPIFDYWSNPGKHLLQHFDGSGRGRENTDFFVLVDSLMRQGYTLDFISDRQLAQTKTKKGKILTNGLDYKTIILPECSYIPLATLKKLSGLAEKGAKVIVHNELPESVPGLANIDERKAAFNKTVNQIKFTSAENKGFKRADVGKGFFLLGNNLQSMLSSVGIQQEAMVDDSLRFVRRSSNVGEYYFIVNKGSSSVSKWIPIQKGGSSVAIFNPQTGTFGMGKQRHTDNEMEVFLQLKPGEACLLNVFNKAVSAPKSYPYYQSKGNELALNGDWNVEFIKGGPTLPKQVSVSNLVSWTDFDASGVDAFSGTARYTITFPKPKENADAWILDLGKVNHSARVKLNGVYLDTLISTPYQVNIPDSILESENNLVVEVSNLMANRIAHMDKKGIQWKKFYNVNFAAKLQENRDENGLFDASQWEPRNSGLLGPVKLIPLKEKVFESNQ